MVVVEKYRNIDEHDNFTDITNTATFDNVEIDREKNILTVLIADKVKEFKYKKITLFITNGVVFVKFVEVNE